MNKFMYLILLGFSLCKAPRFDNSQLDIMADQTCNDNGSGNNNSRNNSGFVRNSVGKLIFGISGENFFGYVQTDIQSKNLLRCINIFMQNTVLEESNVLVANQGNNEQHMSENNRRNQNFDNSNNQLFGSYELVSVADAFVAPNSTILQVSSTDFDRGGHVSVVPTTPIDLQNHHQPSLIIPSAPLSSGEVGAVTSNNANTSTNSNISSELLALNPEKLGDKLNDRVSVLSNYEKLMALKDRLITQQDQDIFVLYENACVMKLFELNKKEQLEVPSNESIGRLESIAREMVKIENLVVTYIFKGYSYSLYKIIAPIFEEKGFNISLANNPFYSMNNDNSLRFNGLEFAKPNVLNYKFVQENLLRESISISDTIYDEIPETPKLQREANQILLGEYISVGNIGETVAAINNTLLKLAQLNKLDVKNRMYCTGGALISAGYQPVKLMYVANKIFDPTRIYSRLKLPSYIGAENAKHNNKDRIDLNFISFAIYFSAQCISDIISGKYTFLPIYEDCINLLNDKLKEEGYQISTIGGADFAGLMLQEAKIMFLCKSKEDQDMSRGIYYLAIEKIPASSGTAV